MSDPDVELQVEAIVSHERDGFRHRFSADEVGMLHIDYQEYVDPETGKLESEPGKGTWRTKETFEGLDLDEVDKICKALRIVASSIERTS